MNSTLDESNPQRKRGGIFDRIPRLRFGLTGSRTAIPPESDRALIQRIRPAAAEQSELPLEGLGPALSDVREQVRQGTELLSDDIVVPTFALVVEAVRRVLGLELFDAQLLGGLAMARGAIAEMQTGEGKTLAALLPAVLHTLAGDKSRELSVASRWRPWAGAKSDATLASSCRSTLDSQLSTLDFSPGHGVHVMTVNPYLARRDYELLAPVFRMLGISIGLIEAGQDFHAKRAAYACAVTYGPGYEFGFDYLRDQVAIASLPKSKLGENFRNSLQGRTTATPQTVQRGHAVAIVDEADSVMIDEATTPLVLSAGGNEPAQDAAVYEAATRIAAQLETGRDFVVDPAAAALRFSPQGLAHISSLSSKVPKQSLIRPWLVYVEQAVRAATLLRRDVHYVVQEGQIRLVDQGTGRILPDRAWRDGLQQAAQAKEGVQITRETASVARIARQRYFRLYGHLCGMTGTAREAQQELHKAYGLRVVVVAPNRPCLRLSLPLRVFGELAAKERAIVEEIDRIHRTQRPILVGTAAIESSERLATLLDELRIPYRLLNGKQDAEEAAIIAQAGQPGAVTLATNLAGRGTDIKLGAGVAAQGGLHVIAAEPQESVRVDRQLAGRAARQGDPGSYQLYVSADDALLLRYGQKLSQRIKSQGGTDGEVVGATTWRRKLARLQTKVQRLDALQRQRLFRHDAWSEGVARDLG